MSIFFLSFPVKHEVNAQCHMIIINVPILCCATENASACSYEDEMSLVYHSSVFVLCVLSVKLLLFSFLPGCFPVPVPERNSLLRYCCTVISHNIFFMEMYSLSLCLSLTILDREPNLSILIVCLLYMNLRTHKCSQYINISIFVKD